MVKHTVTNCLFDIVFAITYLQKKKQRQPFSTALRLCHKQIHFNPYPDLDQTKSCKVGKELFIFQSSYACTCSI